MNSYYEKVLWTGVIRFQAGLDKTNRKYIGTYMHRNIRHMLDHGVIRSIDLLMRDNLVAKVKDQLPTT